MARCPAAAAAAAPATLSFYLLIYPLGFNHAPDPIWASPHATRAECVRAGEAIVNAGSQWWRCVPGERRP